MMARYPHNYIKLTAHSVALAQAIYRCWNLIERKIVNKCPGCSHVILHGVAFTYGGRVSVIPVIIWERDKPADFSIAIWLGEDDLYLSAPETEYQFVDKVVAKIVMAIETEGE